MKYRSTTTALVVIALSAPVAFTQPPNKDNNVTTVAAIEQSLVAAIARAEPSVVSISRVAPRKTSAAGERLGDAFAELRRPQAANVTSTVVASGVIIDRAGLVLTEYLAVHEGDEHTIKTTEGQSYPAEIRAADPRSGLAILAIKPTASPLQRAGEPANNPALGSFPPIRIAEIATLRKGQFVIAIGNPFAIESDGQPTASWGIITNLARKAPSGTNFNDAPGPSKDFRTTLHHLGTLIQTDAKLGWSAGGGVLVNLRGELVGLTTTAATIPGHEQPAGYAIPMSATIRRVIDTLKQGREVEYGMLGVGFGPATLISDVGRVPFGPTLAAEGRLSVTQVYPNGPAARAGLVGGDVLTRIGDQPVDDIDAVQLAVSALPPGTTTTIVYERAGRPEKTTATLAKLAVPGKTIATVRPESWRGIRVDFATTLEAPALTQAINSGAFDPEGCVLVTEVEPESIAWRAGVRPGMFISHVGEKRVTTPGEFHAAVQNLGEELDLKFTTPLSPEKQPAERAE